MGGGRFDVQSSNPDATVLVREGFNRQTQEQVTDILVIDKAAGERQHLGFNQAGEQVFGTPPRPNR